MSSCYHVVTLALLAFIMSKCRIPLVKKTLASGFETLGCGTPDQSGVPSSAFKTHAVFLGGHVSIPLFDSSDVVIKKCCCPLVVDNGENLSYKKRVTSSDK